MSYAKPALEDRDQWASSEDSSRTPGYNFFHWFMMTGFVAFYALLLPVNQRWFSNQAIRALCWWGAFGLGVALLGAIVIACIVYWSRATQAERVTRSWIISFLVLFFLGELFRRHSLWVEWMELPLTLLCGTLGLWALHIGLQKHAERTNREIREKLRTGAERMRLGQPNTISTA
jgi:hypothetical protein